MRSIMPITAGSLSILMFAFSLNHRSYNKLIENTMSGSLRDTVHFTIDNPKSESGSITGLHFYYLDSLAHSQMPNMNRKYIKLPLYAPTILIEANAQQIPFLVYPGERVNIRYAGSDSTQMYIQGNTQRNNEFIFFRKLIQKQATFIMDLL